MSTLVELIQALVPSFKSHKALDGVYGPALGMMASTMNNPPPSLTQAASDASHGFGLMLQIPFNVAREQYANAVRGGFVEQSMLAGAKFERMLGSMEKATLGPWARQV